MTPPSRPPEQPPPAALSAEPSSEVAESRASGPPPQLRCQALSGTSSNVIEVTGTPIVYSQPYTVNDAYGSFTETMAPGVVRAILKTADCRFLFDHQGLPLARTRSGTMTLSDSPTALRFTARLDTRQRLANDLAIALERGDVTQMSVGMIVGRDTWSPDYSKRTIHSIDQLEDVSAVTYPASPSTSIALVGGPDGTMNGNYPASPGADGTRSRRHAVELEVMQLRHKAQIQRIAALTRKESR